MDIVDRDVRSRIMRSIRSANTKPELVVRKAAHALGYRFRLHRRDLPGSPDLAFPSRHKVVFVHGCYWHRHDSCRFAYTPKSNQEFWTRKFAKNVERDAAVEMKLKAAGWEALVIWECETQDLEQLRIRLSAFLGAG